MKPRYIYLIETQDGIKSAHTYSGMHMYLAKMMPQETALDLAQAFRRSANNGHTKYIDHITVEKLQVDHDVY